MDFLLTVGKQGWGLLHRDVLPDAYSLCGAAYQSAETWVLVFLAFFSCYQRHATVRLLQQCKKCSNLRSQPYGRCPLLPWLWRCLTNWPQSISSQVAAWQEVFGCHLEGLVQQKCPQLSPSAQILALKAKGKMCPNVSGCIRMPQRVGGTPVADEIGSEGWHGKGKTHQFLPCLENNICRK